MNSPILPNELDPAERRTIIGETQQAGLPISAPTAGPGDETRLGIGVRWVQKDGYFALECFNGYTGRWVEVPLWRKEEKEPERVCERCGKPSVESQCFDCYASIPGLGGL